jgi:hypothetical protein
MAPTSCFNGQVHRLPDSPSAYGAMITRPKAAPAQSRSAARRVANSLKLVSIFRGIRSDDLLLSLMGLL